jgi:hypothetical protein
MAPADDIHTAADAAADVVLLRKEVLSLKKYVDQIAEEICALCDHLDIELEYSTDGTVKAVKP